MTLDEMIEMTGVRKDGFRLIVDHLLNVESPVIVETGCAREEGNWSGDGMSTLLWSAVPNATVYTVDLDESSVALCRSLVDGKKVTVMQSDGIVGLNGLVSGIPGLHADLLYLDSYDVDMRAPHAGATHALYEFISARPVLSFGSLVAVDDNQRRPTLERSVIGKGMYIDQYMKRAGKPLVHDGYQLIWRW